MVTVERSSSSGQRRQKQMQFMYLLERIGEPLYLGVRGQGNAQVLYNLPTEVLESYGASAMSYLRKSIPVGSDVTVVTISKPSVPYDLGPVKTVPRTALFSYFSPVHQAAADALTKIFMSQGNVEEFFNVCAICRDQVNPHLWIHSFISAAIRRQDMRGFVIPHLWEISPDLYFDAKFIQQGREQASLPVDARAIIEIPIEFTGFDTNPEHKLAYWREDMALNSFHTHWHLSNPTSAPKGSIDRQGELFYFVHHEMVARYNTERMSQGLNRVTPLYLAEGSIIEEAYFSKLTVQNAGRAWGSRQENTPVKDSVRPKDPSFGGPWIVSDLRIYTDRIKEAIDAGFALGDNGKKIDLRNEQGIHFVGSMMEPTQNSVNRPYYGNVHGAGHQVIAYTQDPDFRYREQAGVMLSTFVSCRDPSFWRWHMYIELMLRRQKNFLTPYTQSNLSFEGVTVKGLELVTPSLEKNTLLTFWMQSDVDLSRGLDFFRTDLNNLGPIWARVTHLNHRDFEYKLTIRNSKPSQVSGTVRIFLAPKKDEQGDLLPLKEQRTLFFQMDKFTTKLKPGDNIVSRKSTESSVNIPWDQTFRKFEREVLNPTGGTEAFCGCGWPEHLSVPKGKHEGLPMDVFVMVSDWELDRVEDIAALNLTDTEKEGCVDAPVLCGALGRKYPDARAMGYPLDRLPAVDPETNVAPGTMADFIKPYSNMLLQEIKVFHRDVTIVREDGAPPGTRVIKEE